ncbi:MAG: D-tyrosyl-tRNA(Tyr) deacylase [Clostridia bacterium]|nr:D-tyrosyl-tRNA(Tyr) deacylase [Clostridia bacterium]
MTAVLQRVAEAAVAVDGKTVGSCNGGLLILLGVAEGDAEEDALLLANKIAKLRIFSDEAGKMNLSISDVHGEALVISNFTLLANYKHGNRPDYLGAAKPEAANALYEHFVALLSKTVGRVEKGVFGADMKVSLVNDGPVTLVLHSEVLKKTGKA